MKTSNFQDAAPLAPVNRTAGLITSKGEHYTPKFEITHKRMHAPPLLAQLPSDPTFKNYTGLKIGRLTVYGYVGSGKNGSRWAVRCVCGVYEIRRGGFVGNPDNAPDAECAECHHVGRLRRSYSSVDKLKFHHLPKQNPAGR